MKPQCWFVLSSVLVLSLSSCSQAKKSLEPGEIAQKVSQSVVLISYKDRGGNGSGFIVPGEEGVCTVLTSRHVIPAEGKVQLRTDDKTIWEVSNIKRFDQQDLALVTFKPEQGDCPYEPLEIGDSDSVQKGDLVHISGYFDDGGRLVNHFVRGDVTAIDEMSDGYGIAYSTTTAGGMSGGPVVNTRGEVIAIHGRSSTELAKLAELEGETVEEVLESAVDTEGVGAQVSTFKWGIPTNLYVANRPEISGEVVADGPTAENFVNEGDDFYAEGRYQEALVAYDKALEIDSDSHDAWNNRGWALDQLGKYSEALDSHDKALNIDPGSYNAWTGRGVMLERLGQYSKAIASHDKALKIKPDYDLAWYNRGVSLRKLGKYSEAVASYDKALEIKPDYHEAWYNRGNSLYELGKYSEAVTSHDKAVEIKPDKHEAWNNRGNSLYELGKYSEAVVSYDKAVEIKPDYQLAINNRKDLLKKLGRSPSE